MNLQSTTLLPPLYLKTMQRFAHLLLLCIVLIGTTQRSSALNASILFDDNRSMEVDIIGPTGNRMMRMIIRSNNAQLDHPIDKIVGLKFDLPFEMEELTRNYAFGSYTNVISTLAPLVPQYLPFIEINNNTRPLFPMLVRSYYWVGSHTEAITLCDRAMRAYKDGTPEQNEFRLLRILSMHGQGKHSETERFLRQLPKLERKDPLAPLYWYSMAQLHASTNNLYNANDFAAQIIAFAPKEMDWVPPALHLTARYNASTARFNVARQILDELEIVAMDTPWAARATEFRPVIARMEREHTAALNRKAAEEAAKVDQSPLRKVTVQFD